MVWREGVRGREFLLLHRANAGGPDFEGDWAWTPPSGARQPGEEPDAAAARELREEAGLKLPLTAVADTGRAGVALYLAEAPPGAEVVLDAEHDRFQWLSLEEALPRCLPPAVADGIARAATLIDAGAGPGDPAR